MAERARGRRQEAGGGHGGPRLPMAGDRCQVGLVAASRTGALKSSTPPPLPTTTACAKQSASHDGPGPREKTV